MLEVYRKLSRVNWFPICALIFVILNLADEVTTWLASHVAGAGELSPLLSYPTTGDVAFTPLALALKLGVFPFLALMALYVGTSASRRLKTSGDDGRVVLGHVMSWGMAIATFLLLTNFACVIYGNVYLWLFNAPAWSVYWVTTLWKTIASLAQSALWVFSPPAYLAVLSATSCLFLFSLRNDAKNHPRLNSALEWSFIVLFVFFAPIIVLTVFRLLGWFGARVSADLWGEIKYPLGYLVVWAITYVVGRVFRADRFGLNMSPVVFKWTTTRLNNAITAVANASRRGWRVIGNVGTGIGFALMGYGAYMLYSLAQNLWIMISPPSGSAHSASPVLGALPIPGVFISLSAFPYVILALSIVIASHELAHGIAACASNIKIKSSGILFTAAMLFGGFVDPDDNELASAPCGAKLRVFAAGVATNAVTGILFILLFMNFAAATAPFYVATAAGVRIDSVVTKGAFAMAGIVPGSIITEVNGTTIRSTDDLAKIVRLEKPRETINVKTTDGNFTVITDTDPKNSTHGIMGWSSATNYVAYNAKFPFLPNSLPEFLYRASYWLGLFGLGAAALNMLPVWWLDGCYFLEAALKRARVPHIREIKLTGTIVCAAIIILNILLSLLRFGIVKAVGA